MCGSSSIFSVEEYKTVVYLLLKSICKGEVKKDKVIPILVEVAALHPKMSTLMGDVFPLLDTETQLGRSEERERFIALARACNEFMGYVLLERLDLESLQDTGTVHNKKAFATKVIRTKTRI